MHPSRKGHTLDAGHFSCLTEPFLQLLEAGIQGLENRTSSSVHSVAQTCLN